MKELSDKTGFPNSWESLTKRELKYLITLFLKLSNGGGFSLRDVKRIFTSQVLTWRGIRKEKTMDYMLLVDEVSRTLDWALHFDEERMAAVITYDCIECQIPKCGKFYGPQSYGADLCFGEFRYLLSLLNRISEGNTTLLYEMSGCLYRTRDKKTGRHVKFSTSENYYEKGKRLPEYVQYYSYLWFHAFTEYLMTGDFVIDGCTVNFSSVFAGGGESVPKNFIGMNSILFSVAESRVFGDADDVDSTQLFRILLKLVDDGNKAEELRKQYKQHD